MGLSFSCPFAAYNDPENGMESIIVKSISLGDEESKTPRRSVSFKGKDADPMIMKSLGSGKMVLEGPVSFKQRQTDTLVSISVPSWVDRKADVPERSFCNNNIEMDKQSPKSDENGPSSSITDLASPKHEAALKLQKVYKSFRTRRKLADCAVLVEHSWWKLLDFAVLKHSSISFFDIEHHETAISRWSRAKTRAAKVGKGLSKNDKAQKLALQHWLEAIDPRHRYGHNLHFYYVKWLQSQSREPFFYWLDIGEGKEVNLEKCPRLKLQQQCIKYLGPMERKAYEVAVEDGKLYYRCSGELLDTSSEPHAKWIFVLSTSKTLHVGKKKKGRFQHSSFLAGGATSAAGRLVVEKGILKAVWPHSGHYRPTPENFQDFMSYLRENNVELRDVKMDPIDADEQPLNKQRSSIHIRSGSTEEDFAEEGLHGAAPEQKTPAVLEQPNSLRSRSFIHNLTNLQIPKRDDLLLSMQRENSIPGPSVDDFQREASHDGYDSGTEEEFGSDRDDSVLLHNICDKEFKEDREESIPDESILKRINSHKEAKSYQLGKQLSCKWTTGAGPRIGCVRDYPSELQAQVLEQVNLSPRISGQAKALPSPCCATGLSLKASTPKTLVSQTSIRHCRLQSSPLSRCIKLPLY